jgi:hypothetical protein
MSLYRTTIHDAGESNNQNGGYYKSGVSAYLVKKRRIPDMYTSLQSERNTVTYRMLGKHAKCSHGFAKKTIKEVEEYGERLSHYQRRRTVKPESG